MTAALVFLGIGPVPVAGALLFDRLVHKSWFWRIDLECHPDTETIDE